MGNEQIGDVELALQPQQQLQDALLDDLVERGGDFVADDQVRFRGKRAGDADALFLSTG
jgi:hypothetical protein